jgi:hypothetical protein
MIVKAEVNLTAEETEEMIWNEWSAEKQACLLIEMENRLHNFPIAHTKLLSVCCELYKVGTTERIERVERFLEELLDGVRALREGGEQE